MRNICIASPELLANRKILRVNKITDFRQNEGVFFSEKIDNWHSQFPNKFNAVYRILAGEYYIP